MPRAKADDSLNSDLFNLYEGTIQNKNYKPIFEIFLFN